MIQRFLIVQFFLYFLIFTVGCGTIKVPEKLSSGNIYGKSHIYRRDTVNSNAPVVNESSADPGAENTEGSFSRNNKDRDVLQPNPLGEHVEETTTREPIVDHVGQIPAIKKKNEKSPEANLNKLEASEVVRLDYDQVDLRDVLEEIADTLGINLLVDATIQGKVTMRTSPGRPLHKRDLWSVLQLIMTEFGVTLEKKGNIYHATSKAVVLPGEAGMLKDWNDSGQAGGKVLEFISLQNVSQETILPVLSALVEPHGKVLALPNLNVIGVIAQPYIQKRLASIIPLLDADPFKYRGIRLFRLERAKSTDLAADLEKVLKLIEGDKTTYSVLDLKRLNSILVVAPPERGFQEVERWIEILDSASGENTEQVFVYHVKNLQAKNLAATLSDTFSTRQRSREKESVRRASKTTKSAQEAEKNRKKNKRNDVLDRKLREKSINSLRNNDRVSTEGYGTSADIHLKIVADEDTNSLLVRSTAGDYQQLLKTITRLDTPPLEVMCNIVIAEVFLNETNKFGIDWYMLSRYGDALLGTPFDITDGGNIGDAVNRNIMETPFELTGNSTKKGLVMEGVGGGRLGFVLQALASTGNIKVLSRPSILVRNNQEAVIKVGTEEPTLSSVTNSDIISNGQTAIQNDVQYRDTGIILTVTPHISNDGIINMKVDQEISKLGANRTVYDLPSFDSSKLTTSVIVRDGSAIILGGIIRSHEHLEQDGIPILSDLPIIGPLFATTTNEEKRYELVLIIVPEIVDPQRNNNRLVHSFFMEMRKVAELIDEQMGAENFVKEE